MNLSFQHILAQMQANVYAPDNYDAYTFENVSVVATLPGTGTYSFSTNGGVLTPDNDQTTDFTYLTNTTVTNDGLDDTALQNFLVFPGAASFTVNYVIKDASGATVADYSTAATAKTFNVDLTAGKRTNVVITLGGPNVPVKFNTSLTDWEDAEDTEVTAQ